jgi:hypothetical protein
MRHQCRPSIVSYWCCFALFAVLFFTSCDRRPSLPEASSPGQVRDFTGTWTTTGSRQTMQLAPGHEATIFRFSGSLLLDGQQRLKAGFKADVIGFADSKTGMQGRCVWTDERDELLFSELHGKAINPDQLIEGRFIGGTGRYVGVTGEYSFKWQRLVDNEDGEVSGRVIDLKGWARLESPVVHPSSPGGQQ